jgi:hypothetical protein
MSKETTRRPRTRPNRRLHLSQDDIAALRRDAGDRQAFERLLAACDQWLLDYVSPVPSHADREDMIDAAFFAVLQDLLSPHVSPAMVRWRLEKQLDQQRIRWEKHIALTIRLIENFDPLLRYPSPDDELDLEFWVDVVREIEHCMFPALLSLSEKDQDLLVEAYGLDGIIPSSRPRQTRSFIGKNARRAALSRARGRFRKHLESMLVTTLEVHQRERHLLEAALKIVRGKAIGQAMAAVKGLKRER